MLSRIGGVVILEVVPGVVILIFANDHEGILRGDLLLDCAVPFDVVKLIVRTDTAVVLVIEIQRPGSPTCVAIERNLFGNGFVVRAAKGRVGQVNAVILEQPRVFLLRNVQREAASAY